MIDPLIPEVNDHYDNRRPWTTQYLQHCDRNLYSPCTPKLVHVCVNGEDEGDPAQIIVSDLDMWKWIQRLLSHVCNIETELKTCAATHSEIERLSFPAMNDRSACSLSDEMHRFQVAKNLNVDDRRVNIRSTSTETKRLKFW